MYAGQILKPTLQLWPGLMVGLYTIPMLLLITGQMVHVEWGYLFVMAQRLEAGSSLELQAVLEINIR